MRKKQGFTLIELLAVIVILAVIALIATPIVIGIIEDSRESAFKSSLYSIFDAAEYKLVQDKNTQFPTGGIDVPSLSMNNNKFTSGVVFKDEQGMYLDNVSDGKYCGNGYKDKLEVVKGNCETAAKWFAFDKNTGAITGYDRNAPKNVVIPKTIEGVIVTKIRFYAFANNGLTSIIMPNSVKHIGEGAFMGNLITNLAISNEVNFIGPAAFTNNELPDEQAFIYNRKSDGSEDKTSLNSYGGSRRDSVAIPNNVTTIGDQAFLGTMITSITIPNGVTTIEQNAFNMNLLTNIVLPDTLERIDVCSFQNNELQNVVIPNNVVTIGADAFSNNQITSVTISKSVSTIENSAFSSYNQLISVKIIGKSSSSEFKTYGPNLWGWAEGYSDANITWNATE